MLDTVISNASVGPTEVLVASGIEMFLGTAEVRERMGVGSKAKGFEKLDLKSKVVEHLVGDSSPKVGGGTRAA